MKVMVTDLKDGDSVDSLFSVKYKRAPTPYKSNTAWRFAFGAADSTGEIEVSYWGGQGEGSVRTVHDSFKEGDVVRVQGFVGLWREKNRLKIDINEGKGSVAKAASYDLKDFIPSSGKDIDALYNELLQMVAGVGHEGLRRLLEAFFLDEEFAGKFRKCPGAMQIHHAWLGGLLEHTLSLTKIAREAAKAYENVDLDLLTAGCLLHDVGKIRELEVTTNIKVGEEGMLRGHTVIGEEMVRERARQTGLDGRTLLKLSHMVLSHLGKPEYGAPRTPMFTEAVLLYYADELDSKANQFDKIKKETDTEDFRVYAPRLGEVYLK